MSAARQTTSLLVLTLGQLCFCDAVFAEEAGADGGPAMEGVAAGGEDSGPELPSDAELEANDAVIGRVIVERREIFDTSDPEEDKALYRLANRLHIQTRKSVIESQLLFEPGDPYSRRVLEESARLLRDNRYLYNATVEPVAYADGVVDVRVVTREVWTLSPGFSVSRTGGENKTNIEFEELNLLGTGAKISLDYTSDVDRDTIGIDYSDRQIRDSWVSLALAYDNASDGSRRRISVERPFYSLDTRWGSGITLDDNDRIETLWELGDEVVEFRHDEQLVRAYGGVSRGLRDGWTRRWTGGFVFDHDRFQQTTDPLLAGPVPRDRKLVYPFLGYELIEDRFTATVNHDQIDRTEDFFLGRRFVAQLGWAREDFGADRDAAVFSAFASNGYGEPTGIMWLVSGGLSGRVEDGDLANALVSGSLRYYRNQSRKRLFFASLTADASEALDLDNPLELGGDSGLRGFPLAYQTGSGRALVTLEQRYFTDWYPWRLFRVGGAIFFDAGRTWGTNPVGGSSRGWLTDVGFGLRLGSTRSGINKIIHIDIAFPLNGDESIDDVQFILEGKRSF